MEREWTEFLQFCQDNQDAVAIVVLIVLFVLLTLPSWSTGESWAWLNFLPRRRGRAMKRERRKYLFNDATDGFTDFIESRVYNEQWSRDEAKEVYKMLKRGFPTVRNIFPSPELVKEAIKKRLASGTHEPVKLPDGKWKQVVRRLTNRKS